MARSIGESLTYPKIEDRTGLGRLAMDTVPTERHD